MEGLLWTGLPCLVFGKKLWTVHWCFRSAKGAASPCRRLHPHWIHCCSIGLKNAQSVLVREAAIMTNSQRPPLSKPEAGALRGGGQIACHIFEIVLWEAAMRGKQLGAVYIWWQPTKIGSIPSLSVIQTFAKPFFKFIKLKQNLKKKLAYLFN